MINDILLDIVILICKVFISLLFIIYVVAFVASELYKKGIRWIK
jgi:hypothetical protein